MPARVSTITAGRPLWALRRFSLSGAAAQNRALPTASSPSCLNSWSSSLASPRYHTRLRSTLVAWLTGSRMLSRRPSAGWISSQVCNMVLILSIQFMFFSSSPYPISSR